MDRFCRAVIADRMVTNWWPLRDRPLETASSRPGFQIMQRANPESSVRSSLGGLVGRWIFVAVLISSTVVFAQAPKSQLKLYTLTVQVEGVNSQGGNVGVLIFNSTRGWPEDVHAALKDVVVPARQGVVTVRIENLPAGTYAVAVGHDVNLNDKV